MRLLQMAAAATTKEDVKQLDAKLATLTITPSALNEILAHLERYKKWLNGVAAESDVTIFGKQYPVMLKSWVVIWDKVEEVLRASDQASVTWLRTVMHVNPLVHYVMWAMVKHHIIVRHVDETKNIWTVTPGPVSAATLAALWSYLKVNTESTCEYNMTPHILPMHKPL